MAKKPKPEQFQPLLVLKQELDDLRSLNQEYKEFHEKHNSDELSEREKRELRKLEGSIFYTLERAYDISNKYKIKSVLDYFKSVMSFKQVQEHKSTCYPLMSEGSILELIKNFTDTYVLEEIDNMLEAFEG